MTKAHSQLMPGAVSAIRKSKGHDQLRAAAISGGLVGRVGADRHDWICHTEFPVRPRLTNQSVKLPGRRARLQRVAETDAHGGHSC
jgi:hypothetical protein